MSSVIYRVISRDSGITVKKETNKQTNKQTKKQRMKGRKKETNKQTLILSDKVKGNKMNISPSVLTNSCFVTIISFYIDVDKFKHRKYLI